MIGDIIELYNFVKQMNEDYKNNKKREIEIYIDDVYQKANIVLKDYMDIFSIIRTNVSEEKWYTEDIISYIEKVEYKHKDMRIYLRSLKGANIPLNFICEDDYENFLNSVIQLLACKWGVSSSHTLLGFVEVCRQISIQNIENQREIILNITNNILKYLEITWRKTCTYYNKIRC